MQRGKKWIENQGIEYSRNLRQLQKVQNMHNVNTGSGRNREKSRRAIWIRTMEIFPNSLQADTKSQVQKLKEHQAG